MGDLRSRTEAREGLTMPDDEFEMTKSGADPRHPHRDATPTNDETKKEDKGNGTTEEKDQKTSGD